MNNWTVECTDSDGETDSFAIKRDGKIVCTAEIGTTGNIELFVVNKDETLVIPAKENAIIQSEMYRMWRQMNEANKVDPTPPIRTTFACAECREHIDHGEVKVRTDEGWLPYHSVCAPEPTQHEGITLTGGCSPNRTKPTKI